MEIKFILLAIGAYLLGSVPAGYLAVKWSRGTDIRKVGTGKVAPTVKCILYEYPCQEPKRSSEPTADLPPHIDFSKVKEYHSAGQGGSAAYRESFFLAYCRLPGSREYEGMALPSLGGAPCATRSETSLVSIPTENTSGNPAKPLANWIHWRWPDGSRSGKKHCDERLSTGGA